MQKSHVLAIAVALAVVVGLAWQLTSRHADSTGDGSLSKTPADSDFTPAPSKQPTLLVAPTKRRHPAKEGLVLDKDHGGVFGRVVHAMTGAPAPNVPVHVFDADWSQGASALVTSATSDKHGQYRVKVKSSRKRVFVIACGAGLFTAFEWPDYWDDDTLPPSLRASVVDGEWFAHDVRVRASARVEGRVTLPSGAPAVGATVRPWTHNIDLRFPWEELPPAQTDKDGRYVIDWMGDTHGTGVAAELDGYLAVYADTDTRIVPGEAGIVDLQFAEPLEVDFTVESMKTGERLAGANVTVTSSYFALDDDRIERQVGTSNLDGRVALAPVRVDECRVYVECEGYALMGFPGERRNVRMRKRETGNYEATVKLRPLSTITGTVEWEDTTSSLANVSIRATGKSVYNFNGWDATVDATRDGSFVITAPPSGRLTLTATTSNEHGTWSSVKKANAGDKDVVLRLKRDPPTTSNATAGDHGTEEGYSRWTIQVADHRGVALQHAKSIEILRIAKTLDHLDLREDIHFERGTLSMRVPSDSGGIWLGVHGGRTTDDRLVDPFMIGPLRDGDDPLNIIVPESKSIRGRVTGPGHKPLPGAEVVARPARTAEPYRVDDHLPWSHGSAFTDGDGYFELRGLTQSKYVVSAHKYNTLILPPDVVVASGSTHVTLDYAAPVTQRIYVKDPNGAPVAEAWVGFDQRNGRRGPYARYEGLAFETNQDGLAIATGLEALGTYKVDVAFPNGSKRYRYWVQKFWKPKDDVFLLKWKNPRRKKE